MTTVLQARPRRFVHTPAVERVAARTLRYLQSGFAVHLRGPAGTGKTTLALHLADLLGRPIMLIFGDDEFKTSDLIGNQTGYTRKKVVDNFIHSVVKVEDELKQNWVDSRLTLACREGFTLVYDEFNRSRPEVNNVLLSALEEKLLVLPPSSNRSEYIRVHPQFRAIFTSNPEEYCGVHATQDALMDRLITINVPEPDELTQQEILVQKVEISREEASLIVQLVKAFRGKTTAHQASGLRSCLMIAKICHEHNIPIQPEDLDFRDVCHDILLARTNLPPQEATTLIWGLLRNLSVPVSQAPAIVLPTSANLPVVELQPVETANQMASEITNEELQPLENLNYLDESVALVEMEPELTVQLVFGETAEETASQVTSASILEEATPHEQEIYNFLQRSPGARVSEIEKAVGVNRFETVNALRSLAEQGVLVQQHNRVYIAQSS